LNGRRRPGDRGRLLFRLVSGRRREEGAGRGFKPKLPPGIAFSADLSLTADGRKPKSSGFTVGHPKPGPGAGAPREMFRSPTLKQFQPGCQLCQRQKRLSHSDCQDSDQHNDSWDQKAQGNKFAFESHTHLPRSSRVEKLPMGCCRALDGVAPFFSKADRLSEPLTRANPFYADGPYRRTALKTCHPLREAGERSVCKPRAAAEVRPKGDLASRSFPNSQRIWFGVLAGVALR